MNFVDFVIDCYSHITSHVSQVFASRTHYTSYSLLNIVHVIVCVYGLINHVFAITLNYVQTKFVAWKFVENAKNFVFGNFGLKILDFEKHTILYSCIFVLKIQCFESNHLGFSKIVFFQKWWVSAWFDRSILFFDRSKFLKFFKIWERVSLSVSTGQGWFSTDRNLWIRFFKRQNWTFSKSLFK